MQKAGFQIIVAQLYRDQMQGFLRCHVMVSFVEKGKGLAMGNIFNQCTPIPSDERLEDIRSVHEI